VPLGELSRVGGVGNAEGSEYSRGGSGRGDGAAGDREPWLREMGEAIMVAGKEEVGGGDETGVDTSGGTAGGERAVGGDRTNGERSYGEGMSRGDRDAGVPTLAEGAGEEGGRAVRHRNRKKTAGEGEGGVQTSDPGAGDVARDAGAGGGRSGSLWNGRRKRGR